MFQASQPVVGVGGYRRRSSGQGAICDPELDDSGNKLVARLEDDAFISEQDLVSHLLSSFSFRCSSLRTASRDNMYVDSLFRIWTQKWVWSRQP